MPVAVSPPPSACDPHGPVARLLGARPGDEVRVFPSHRAAYAALAGAVPAGSDALVLETPGGSSPRPALASAGIPRVRVLPTAATLAGTVARLGDVLTPTVALLVVPGADPVTGELLPVAELADLAHARGAALAVDATLLAPAGRLDLAATGVDHAVLDATSPPRRSAGPSVLVGRPPGPVPVSSAPVTRLPDGAWSALTDLADLPDGVLAAHVAGLRSALVTGLRQLPGVRVLQHWPDATAHAGVLALAVDSWPPGLLARRLATAPRLPRLDAVSAAVRVTLGAGSGPAEVRALLDALEDVVTSAAPTP
jgi:selenocysteine lyase/cysteine desulfurase